MERTTGVACWCGRIVFVVDNHYQEFAIMTPMKNNNTQYVPGMSLFAQLLANEGLQVRVNADAKTAYFDPDARCLTLPHWSGFDHDAWMLFIAHEVGHALETPKHFVRHPKWVALSNLYGKEAVLMTANVFEDIRIERLVRKRYAGLNVVFVRGYNSLLNKGFFGTEEEAKVYCEASTLDRINLYAKVGSLWRLSLTKPTDIQWFNRGLAAETFDDVMTLVEDVMLALTKQNEALPKTQMAGAQQSGKNGESRQQGEQNGQKGAGQSGGSQQGQNGQNQQGQDGRGSDQNGEGNQEQDGDTGQGAAQGLANDSRQDNSSGETGQNADSTTQDAATNGQTDASATATGAGTGVGNPFTCESQQRMNQRLNDSVESYYSGMATIVLPKPKPTKTYSIKAQLVTWGNNYNENDVDNYW